MDGANVSGYDTAARAKENPGPVYPLEAARNGITGRVVLLIDVAPDGRVADAKVAEARPAGIFEKTALEQVRKWTFEPAMKDGSAVASRVRVPIDFDIEPQQEAASASLPGAIKRGDYGWYKTDLHDGQVRDMRCDVLVMGEKGREQDAACGIHRPKVGKDASAAADAAKPGTKILADVAPDGTTSNVHLDTDRAPDKWERAMMEALRKHRQTPPMKDGVPVAGQVVIDTAQAIPVPPGARAAS